MKKLRCGYPSIYDYLKNGAELKPRQLDFHYSVISHYSDCLFFVTDNNDNYKDNIHGTL